MSATVFTIANQKGGVGKTTTAVNLSVALARKGIRTLLVDLDPQANATSAVGIEKTPDGSLYRCLHGEGDAASKIRETRTANLSLIPSEVDLAAIEVELNQKPDYLAQLKRCLDPIRKSGRFDAILLDCPPAIGMISLNGMAAADYLLIALQTEYLAMEGLTQILNVLEQIKQSGVNNEIRLGGIIMTMFDIRTNLHRQVVDEVRKHFPEAVFEAIIPRSIRLAEAPSFGQSIFEYDASSTGAIAYTDLAKEVRKRFHLKKG